VLNELIQGGVSLEGKGEINQGRPKKWLLVLISSGSHRPLTLQALTQSQTGHAKWKCSSCVNRPLTNCSSSKDLCVSKMPAKYHRKINRAMLGINLGEERGRKPKKKKGNQAN